MLKDRPKNEISLLEVNKQRLTYAKKSRFIPLEDFAHILGTDETYDSILGNTFEKYGCQKRNPNPPNTIVMWILLLERWTSGGHDVPAISEITSVGSKDTEAERQHLPALTIGGLPLYRFDYETINFEKKNADYFFKDARKAPRYLNLNDVKQYFTEKLEIPLPKAL